MILKTCTCNEGWSGTGCDTPVCPGEPEQCNGRGVCDGTLVRPICKNCVAGIVNYYQQKYK